MANNYTVIEDLIRKLDIEDDNLIIVEDDEDTKKSTISELKKNFLADYRKEPSETTFYSSKKLESILDDFRRQLSTYASDADVQLLEKRIQNIIASTGSGKDTEIIDARDGLSTLSARLQRDIDYADDRYIKKIRKVIEGTEVSTGDDGYVDIYLKNMSGNSATIYFNSKNLLNIAVNANTAQVVYNKTGFVYTQSNTSDLSVSLKFNNSLPKGTYYFYASALFDNTFKDKGNIKLAVKNSKDDSAYKEFTYNQGGKFTFEAPKPFNEIKLIFNLSNYAANSKVTYSNIMLMRSDKYDSTYIPYASISASISKDKYIKGYNANYDITCSDKNAIIRVEYYDDETTAEKLQNDVDELKATILDNRDKCGLVTNYGDYLFFNNAVCETPTSCRLSLDDDIYMRNGVPSLNVIFQEDVNINPVFAIEMDKYIENIDSVSIVFYIDKTTSYYFTSSEPITINLCSDSYNEPEMVNYFSIKINKNELLQGWNIIKKNIVEFSVNGSPNEHGIKYVKVEIDKNSGLDNKNMYFNSIIFNQKIKPVVLLAFDGIYEEGINYAYPYLTTRGIPATILSNNRSTFSRAVLEKIVELRAKYGWDLGQYGCNPNKELLTEDDNARNQYLALKTAKIWLQDNLVYNPISYSAPYGNLRPITVPILKDLGYKIAKTSSPGYCNFFDPKFDFAIPMTLMSNTTTAESIIKKLQYAIDNECCICIYTNNVTDYGDEASAKKVLLEDVVNFILENKDKIIPMTFTEFYNKCNL